MPAEIRGVTIDYEVTGTGRHLVWGHGLTSSRADEAVPPSLLSWDRIAAGARVLRYDARGHGRSGFSDAPDAYAWDELARDQLALVDLIGFDRYVAGGASMGAATVLHAAVMAPDRVEALILVIPPTAWETRAAQADLYRQMAEIVDHRGVAPLIAAGRDQPPPDPFLGDERYRRRAAARLDSADPARLAGVLRGAAHADLPAREAIGALEIPTLVLAWSGDPGHPVGSAEALAELIDGAVLSIASTAVELATWTDRVIEFVEAL